MPDYNASVALGLNAEPVDLSKTINTLSNIQLSQAHSGLYTLQALQQQRQFNALQQAAAAYRGGQDPVAPYIAAGGDPAGANTLQGVFAGQRAMAATPGGLMPGAFEQLTGAAKNRAEIGKIGVETQAAGGAFASKLAGGVIADPTNDQTWAEAVDKHFDAFGGSKLQRENAKRVSDPNQRLQIARAYSGQGTSPDELNKPVAVQPGEGFTTAGRLMQPGGGAAVAPISVGGKKEQEEYGTTLGKEPATLAEKAEGARQQNFTLEQMKAESASWPMGKGAETLMKAGQYMKPIANAFGNTSFDQPVADFESFQKNAGVLTRQAVKEVSSRAAVQEFQMIQNQLPNATMTRQGFSQIADQFHAVNDYQIAKQQAAQAWRDKNGTMDKFDSDWNRNISPTAFLVNRMSPEQLHQVAAGLQKTAEGRAALASITRQIQYAQEQRLF